MVYKCNLDSFLRKFTSTVVSCEPTTENKVAGFNVEFEDTILFPEGGGQPCDHGTVNGIPVTIINRSKERALNFFEGDNCPFQIGEEVEMEIDWNRRLDHMQHHSGQHLISALFEKKYQYPTKSWYLGADYAFIEFSGTDNITQEQLDEIEHECNRIIVQCLPVTMKVYSRDDPILLEYITPSGEKPPEDASEIKVISIGEIDHNMCCGTHVKNTGQLQSIVLLNVEKKKMKLTVNFMVGGRVLKSMKDSYQRELNINNLLNNGPPMHAELIKKLQSGLKLKNKSLEYCSKLLAAYEANQLKQQTPLPKYYTIHHTGIDYLAEFTREFRSNEVFLFITFIDETNTGKLFIRGSEDQINSIGSEIADTLDGKFNKKGGFIQGRFNNIKKINECNKKLQMFFEKN